MENSNLDVWAIQGYPEELQNALKNIQEGSTDNLLYTNCSCDFEIGGEKITTRQFDTMLYSPSSDTLVLLMRDGKATPEDIKKNLAERGISYREIANKKPTDSYENDESIKDLWFAREKYVLVDALKNSKEKGYRGSIYHPEVASSLRLTYLTPQDEVEALDGRNSLGVVELPDKLVLLISQDDQRNITERQVYDAHAEVGMNILVDYRSEIGLHEKETVKVLK